MHHVTTMSSTTTLTRKKRKFSEKSSSRNVLEKMTNEILPNNNVILQMELMELAQRQTLSAILSRLRTF